MMINDKTARQNGHNQALIDLRQVVKSYVGAAGTFHALQSIDLQAEKGQFVAVVGKSGSGKSTLLNMLAGLDSPTSGEVWINGTAIHDLNQDQLAAWRGRTVGVVFQFFQLLPTLTVAENVMLPMDFRKTPPVRECRGRALHLLEQVGIVEQADKLPAKLSGGQQQRAAIARALANDPALVLADEPTGNLDSHTAEAILQLFKALAEYGKTVVMVTHERDISQWASRVVTLADGQIVNTPAAVPTAAAEVTHA